MTRQKIILLFLFLLTYFAGIAQPVTTDFSAKEYKMINGFIDYLQVSSLIPLDSVLLPGYQKKFIRLKNEPVIFLGYTPYYYWYRFTITNKDSTDKTLILLLGGLGIRKAEIWQGKNNYWQFAGRTGYQYPFEKRHYRYVHPSFALTIPAISTDTFYVNVDESHSYKSIAFVLTAQSSMQKFEHRFYFMMGIIIGLLLLFAVLNLHLYFSIKESIHLWYCFYIVSILFFVIKEEGIDPEFLGLDSANGYRMTYMGAVAILAVGFLLQVVQTFLINIKPSSLLYKIIIFLKWSSFLLAIIQFIIFYIQPANNIEVFVFQWANKTTLASFIFILLACMYSFYKGFKPAAFILAGQAVFIIGGISRTLFIATESYFFPPSLFEIGLVAEVIIISFGLMYRYNQYKKEKESLAFQLQEEKIKTTAEILNTQEQEKKRIAADLHDELGGNLAAIKMTMQSFKLAEEQSGILNYLIDTASANARHIAHNLMPPQFENISLQVLLEQFYHRLNTEGKIVFHFFYSGKKNPFTKQEDLMIYRIIMELTNNIIKHSQATDATIQLVFHEKQLTLMAEDNGKGIVPRNNDGIGLKNVQLRVSFLNGQMDVDSAESGTTLMIQIPYK